MSQTDSVDPFAEFGDRPPYGSRAPQPPVPWAQYLGLGLLTLSIAGTVAFATAPSPYVVEQPGPVFDTLGTVVGEDDEPIVLIEVDGAPTYDTEGHLDMLTVQIVGTRESPLSWFDVAVAWVDPSRAILPVDVVYPDGQTAEESDEESAVQMTTSQQDAIAAALTELDIPFQSTLTVGGTFDDTPSVGVLEVGDELLAAQGEPVADVTELRAVIADVGVGGTLTLAIRRDGSDREVTLNPVASEDGTPVIGIFTAAEYDFPVDVEIRLERVGGPSAGMMFALAIVDKLTPGALTGGEHIAGTGTITPTGEVGAIGGIVQKMYGAREEGAEWFLAPAANCDEVVGKIPAGLEVYAVATLEEALATVDAVAAGDTADLARCTG